MAAAADDYYARLGVPRTAGLAELRRAYRLLALRLHPDRAGPGSTERFQRLSEAYQVLSDAQCRARYDAGLDRGDPPPSRTHGDGEYVGSGGRVTWRTRQARGRRLDRLSGPLEVLLARGVALHTPDGVLDLFLTPPEAASGGVAAIETRLSITCPTCSGVAGRNRVWCRRCEYSGEVADEVTVLVDIPPNPPPNAQFTFHPDGTTATSPLRVRLRVP
jgi:molecular chaperone DnaJ